MPKKEIKSIKATITESKNNNELLCNDIIKLEHMEITYTNSKPGSSSVITKRLDNIEACIKLLLDSNKQQLEFNKKQEEFNKQVLEFIKRQEERWVKQEAFNKRQEERWVNQEKFNKKQEDFNKQMLEFVKQQTEWNKNANEKFDIIFKELDKLNKNDLKIFSILEKNNIN